MCAGLDLYVVPGDTYPVRDDSELSFDNLAWDKDGIFRIVSSDGLKVANEASPTWGIHSCNSSTYFLHNVSYWVVNLVWVPYLWACFPISCTFINQNGMRNVQEESPELTYLCKNHSEFFRENLYLFFIVKFQQALI